MRILFLWFSFVGNFIDELIKSLVERFKLFFELVIGLFMFLDSSMPKSKEKYNSLILF